MITVKDIRDKQFAVQKHGYHEDEVDEFLDEIADQMEALIRENRALVQKVEDAKAAQACAEEALKGQAAPSPAPSVPFETAPAAEPKVDDSSYFKNLETTLRETLLSAQRIADQTVAEARQKAEKAVAEAESRASSVKADAQREADQLMGSIGRETEEAKAQLESLKQTFDEHKTRFIGMLEEQLKALKPEDKA